MIHHITRASRHLIFWSLIIVALGLTGVRLLMTFIDSYKMELQSHISDILDAPVQIGTLKAHMYGFIPTLILTDIKVAGVADAEQPAVKLDEIRLHIDLQDVLLKQDLWNSFWVTLVGAELSVIHRTNGSFAIVGLKANTEDERPVWLLQGRKFKLLHSRITWLSEKSKSKPLAFNGVNLLIKNDGDRHQLHMLLKPPASYGDTLRVSMVFDGDFFEPANINGDVYFEGHGIHLAKFLAGELPFDISIDSGFGAFKVWTQWRRSQLIGVIGDIEMRQLSVKAKQLEAFSADHLSTLFKWKQQNHTWQLDVSDFALTAGNHAWSPAQFSLRGEQGADGQWRRGALAVTHLELQEAVQILIPSGLLPAEQAKLLASLNMSGQLAAFSLSMDFISKQFVVDGQFRELNFSSFKTMPGISGLSGVIHGNERQGSLQLETGAAQLIQAGLFRHELAISRLDGMIDWQQTPDDWVVRSNRIVLDAAGIKTESRMKLVLPKNEASPFLDLQTGFSMDDVSQVAHYLPATMMNPNTLVWLDRAFIAGRIPDGGLLIHGELADFPFTAGQGVFEVLFNTEEMELSYHPEWPSLSKLDAEVRFWAGSLTVNVHKAKTMQCSVEQAVVTIPSLERSQHVKVRGQAEGSIPEVLDFLRQTPLKASIDRVLGAITPEGMTSVELELDAPLVKRAPVIVDGSATFKGARLSLGSFKIPVTQIDGALKFNEQGVFANELKATALGHLVQVRIDNRWERTVINVAGHAGIADVWKRFDLPEWELATGETDYQLALTLPYDERSGTELSIRSDLQGVALGLPESLAKTSEQKRPLALTFKLGDEQVLPVSLNYDNTLKASFTIDVPRRAIQSGHFLYGEGQAIDPGRGVKLVANQERIRMEDWLSLSGNMGETSGWPIDQVEIYTNHLLNKNQDIGRLDLLLKRSPAGWNGTIRSLAAEGKIYIVDNVKGGGKIRLDMKFIDFSMLKRFRMQGMPRQAGPLPLFDISSRKTYWRSVDLGWLELETERKAGGLMFKRVELTGTHRKLSLTGSWIVNNGRDSTELQGSFNSEHFGSLIKELGLYEDMKETTANSDFVLNWRGAPYQFSLAELTGHVDVKLKNGRLLSIEPGVGRVLGILAFAQWGKRLQLDFRDVFKEGLSFNSIRGRVELSHGIARTNNLVVNAVPAKISLAGDVNLIDRTLDQWVTVVPKSSDAVPIAGTIVGRIAGFVASTVTDDYKEGYFFGSEYQVKGSWQEPEIVPLHENDGLFQKTWQGITDFPWVEEK